LRDGGESAKGAALGTRQRTFLKKGSLESPKTFKTSIRNPKQYDRVET
jgi:hypothetical protein